MNNPMRRKTMNFKGMKKGAVILSAVLLLGFLTAGAADRDRYEERFDRTENLARDGRVVVKNISGDIEIKTWDKEQVKIEALKVAEASSEDRAKEDAALVRIEVSRTDGTLRIETKYPEHGWGHKSLDVSVDYSLWIPDKAGVEADSVSGDISAAGIGGAMDLDTVSGEVEVESATKGAECKSVSGGVRLRNVTGDVYLKSVSGSVEAEGVLGAVEAESVSGDIELRGVDQARMVRAKVVSGDVTYQGKISSDGKYTLSSHSGDVEVFLPADSAFEFEAESFSGHIESDFSIELSGKISAKEFHGVVNKGGAYLKLASFSGNVRLRKR
jgi:DUF4097 and DUF4098 domain-containing protein YvlB